MADAFISYKAGEGLDLAYGVYAVLTYFEVTAWLWHLHHESGRDTFEEMAKELGASTSLFVICTENTRNSDGQIDEIGQAKAQKKDIYVLPKTSACIPESLVRLNHDEVTLENLVAVIGKIVQQWERRPGARTYTHVNDGDLVVPKPVVAENE